MVKTHRKVMTVRRRNWLHNNNIDSIRTIRTLALLLSYFPSLSTVSSHFVTTFLPTRLGTTIVNSNFSLIPQVIAYSPPCPLTSVLPLLSFRLSTTIDNLFIPYVITHLPLCVLIKFHQSSRPSATTVNSDFSVSIFLMELPTIHCAFSP